MELIHHEVQQGQLCAQHCLNSLLQSAEFDAIQLGGIAAQLDEVERSRMAEGTAEEYTRFLAEPSCNMDDSGFFSIQVILKALEIYGLRAEHWHHPSQAAARQNPCSKQAYICNLNQHWFTIRKIGLQWFVIDSCKSGPELVSDTYLEVYLKQIELDGYTVFVVSGSLPECVADAVLRLTPIDPVSVRKKPLKKAEPPPPAPLPPVHTESVDEIRRKRLLRLEGGSSSSTAPTAADPTAADPTAASTEVVDLTGEGERLETEDEMLRIAIEMSLR